MTLRTRQRTRSDVALPAWWNGAGAALLAAVVATGCQIDKLFGTAGNSEPEPGAPAKLAFTSVPSSIVASTAIPPIEVIVQDGFGDRVSGYGGPVTISLDANPANGRLVGTTTRNAVGGIAVFNDLQIDRAGAGYRLSAAAPDLTAATSGLLNVEIRPGFELLVVSGGGQTDTVAARLPQPYIVQVVNTEGQAVSGVSVSWSLSDGAGSVSSSQTNSDANGFARVFHTLGRTAGQHSVQATVAQLVGSPVTFTSTARAATVAHIAFAVPPSDTDEQQVITPAVTVVLQDRFGNIVTHANSTVQVAITPGTGDRRGRLSGTLTRTPVNGVVQFDDLSIDRNGNNYRLRVFAAGLFTDSPAFDIE